MTDARDALLDRIVARLRADDRMLAVWLSGSLGRGDGDQFSDVDLLVAVGDESWDAVVAEWDAGFAAIAPVVLRNRISSSDTVVFAHVTEDWLRFDVVLARPSTLHEYAAADLRLLFDRAGCQTRLAAERSPAAPNGPQVEGLVHEFLRVLGLLPVALGRGEYVVGVSGAGLLRNLLIQLMMLDRPVRRGALRLGGVLPDDRLAALSALPPVEATPDSVLAAHLACAELFLPLARELSARTRMPWPERAERALRAHLRRTLTVELPVVTS
jgi:predicted nucleotidyltransferase